MKEEKEFDSWLEIKRLLDWKPIFEDQGITDLKTLIEATVEIASKNNDDGSSPEFKLTSDGLELLGYMPKVALKNRLKTCVFEAASQKLHKTQSDRVQFTDKNEKPSLPIQNTNSLGGKPQSVSLDPLMSGNTGKHSTSYTLTNSENQKKSASPDDHIKKNNVQNLKENTNLLATPKNGAIKKTENSSTTAPSKENAPSSDEKIEKETSKEDFIKNYQDHYNSILNKIVLSSLGDISNNKRGPFNAQAFNIEKASLVEPRCNNYSESAKEIDLNLYTHYVDNREALRRRALFHGFDDIGAENPSFFKTDTSDN